MPGLWTSTPLLTFPFTVTRAPGFFAGQSLATTRPPRERAHASYPLPSSPHARVGGGLCYLFRFVQPVEVTQ
jgi:hypothetical protein